MSAKSQLPIRNSQVVLVRFLMSQEGRLKATKRWAESQIVTYNANDPSPIIRFHGLIPAGNSRVEVSFSLVANYPNELWVLWNCEIERYGGGGVWPMNFDMAMEYVGKLEAKDIYHESPRVVQVRHIDRLLWTIERPKQIVTLWKEYDEAAEVQGYPKIFFPN